MEIDIPFGAKDSELKGWRYTIPEGYTAEIKDGEIIVKSIESEDEMIRKGLVKLLTAASESFVVESTGIKKGSYLAWLEKQKEPTEELSTRLNGLMQEYVKSGKDEEEQEHRLKCYQLFWDALGDSEFFKKKEQKLEENSVYPHSLDEAIQLYYYTYGNGKGGFDYLSLPKFQDIVKDFVKSYGQKPVEWSEEDEKALELVTDCIYEYYPDLVMKYKLKDWLKSLKNRGNSPESNTNSQNVWSEEDEATYDAFICEVVNKKMNPTIEQIKWLRGIRDRLKSLRPQSHKWYIKKGHWYMCIVDKSEYGWTKGKVYQSPEDNRIETNHKGSLTNWPNSEPWFRPATRDEIPDNQPHWKPSEEQMQALRLATNNLWIKEHLQAHILISLYNDLEKLM